MKKLLFGCIVLLLCCLSCGNRKTKVDPFASLTAMVDSAQHRTAQVDTLALAAAQEAKEQAKMMEPSDADELFDDFIFNFATNEKLQKARTLFPLPYYKGDSCLRLQPKYWRHDYLFAKQNFYTLLFDREEDMELVGDTALKSVQVEWIYLKTHSVKKYYFERKEGIWRLEAINLRPIPQGDDEDFVSFYTRFSSDSVYQAAHIHEPLAYVTIDPDDEFSILETTLEASQWAAFRSIVPSDHLTNINYGQRNDDQSSTKMIKINGIGNGYSVVYYFRRRAGEWKLYKFEDTSI